MTVSTFELIQPEDIAAFLEDQAGTITQYRQFSRGPCNLRYLVVDLNGVILMWAHGGTHALWRDHVKSDNEIRFGYVVRSDASVVSQGRDVTPNDAVVWVDNAETEYLFKGGVETLEMVVEPRIARMLGWQVDGSVLRTTPHGSLQRLTQICRSATAAMQSENTFPLRARQDFWREEVLQALEAALMPWLGGNAQVFANAKKIAKEYSLFRLAERAVDDLNAHAPHIQDLSKQVGVSRRRLEFAFRQCAGVGPRRFFEVQRLHDLRASLMLGTPDKTSVTRQAMEQGFNDLGRMAQKYRTLFGENPSATLRAETHWQGP